MGLQFVCSVNPDVTVRLQYVLKVRNVVVCFSQRAWVLGAALDRLAFLAKSCNLLARKPL